MYRTNSNTWMTASIFQEWLLQFDKAMRQESRHVLLLLDNATSHKAPAALSNVKPQYFAPNMTSKIQPLDAGIIYSFKCHYRKLQLQKMIDMADSMLHVDLILSDAIRFCRMAWDSVTRETVSNCWNHIGFIFNALEPSNSEENEDTCSVQDFGNLFDRIAVTVFSKSNTQILCPQLSSLKWTPNIQQ